MISPRTCSKGLANPRNTMEQEYHSLSFALDYIVKCNSLIRMNVNEGMYHVLLILRKEQALECSRIEVYLSSLVDMKVAPSLLSKRKSRYETVANHKLVVRESQMIVALSINWLRLCTEIGFMRGPFGRESFGINHDPAFDLLNVNILLFTRMMAAYWNRLKWEFIIFSQKSLVPCK